MYFNNSKSFSFNDSNIVHKRSSKNEIYYILLLSLFKIFKSLELNFLSFFKHYFTKSHLPNRFCKLAQNLEIE